MLLNKDLSCCYVTHIDNMVIIEYDMNIANQEIEKAIK